MKALVVEDDFLLASWMEQMLRRAGWEVTGPLPTGEEAVDVALAAEELDIIILDIRLAGNMDGLQAAEAIRARMPTPILFCTAHADAKTRGRIDEIGNAYLMPKPAERDVLWRALGQLRGANRSDAQQVCCDSDAPRGSLNPASAS